MSRKKKPQRKPGWRTGGKDYRFRVFVDGEEIGGFDSVKTLMSKRPPTALLAGIGSFNVGIGPTLVGTSLCHACKEPLSTPTEELGGYILHAACAAARRNHPFGFPLEME